MTVEESIPSAVDPDLLRHEYVECRLGQLHVTFLADPNRTMERRLVLLNTRSRSLRALLPLVRDFAQAVVVDIPGTGQSSPPRAGSVMGDVAACLADLLDHLGWRDPVDFLGFHTGQKVTAAFAVDHPERVRRTVIAGKTHSLIPDKDRRVAAMRAYIERGGPDSVLVEWEGRYLDDGDSLRQARARMFEVNFAFDFEAALRAMRQRTLILEVTTPLEDRLHGRQGAAVAGLMQDAIHDTLPEVEPTGLYMYAGREALADRLVEFLSEQT